jgi:hypothetical protein
VKVAYGHDAAVSVAIFAQACDCAATDLIGQRQGSSLATSPLAAISSHARLVAFRCVDSVQPDSLAMDFQRIAVDDGGDANDQTS